MQPERTRTVYASDLSEGEEPGQDWRVCMTVRTGNQSEIVAWKVPDPDWYISQLGDA